MHLCRFCTELTSDVLLLCRIDFCRQKHLPPPFSPLMYMQWLQKLVWICLIKSTFDISQKKIQEMFKLADFDADCFACFRSAGFYAEII